MSISLSSFQHFEQATPLSKFHIQEADQSLQIETKRGTDYWVHTHYNFVRDNGHFIYCKILPASQNFTFSFCFKGDYKFLYDQLGCMIRYNENYWIKTGIEFVEGVQNISAVVTNQKSDWNVVPITSFDNRNDWLYIRIKKEIVNHLDCYDIEYSLDEGKTFHMLRMTYLLPPSHVDKLFLGIMAASPTKQGDEEGFTGYFKNFQLNTN